jgi:hypothetical protein
VLSFDVTSSGHVAVTVTTGEPAVVFADRPPRRLRVADRFDQPAPGRRAWPSPHALTLVANVVSLEDAAARRRQRSSTAGSSPPRSGA